MHRLDRCSFVWLLVFMCNVYALVDISNWTTARRTDRQTDGQTDRRTIWGIYVTSTQRNIPQNSSSDFWLLRLRLSCVRHGGVECWIVGYRGCWATICAFVSLILFGIQISFVFFCNSSSASTSRCDEFYGCQRCNVPLMPSNVTQTAVISYGVMQTAQTNKNCTHLGDRIHMCIWIWIWICIALAFLILSFDYD